MGSTRCRRPDPGSVAPPSPTKPLERHRVPPNCGPRWPPEQPPAPSSRRELRTLKTIQPTRNPDVAEAGPTTTAISLPGIQGGNNAEWAVEIIENRGKPKTY